MDVQPSAQNTELMSLGIDEDPLERLLSTLGSCEVFKTIKLNQKIVSLPRDCCI